MHEDRLNSPERFGVTEAVLALGACAGFAFLAMAVACLPDTPSQLVGAVAEAQPETGLGNRVNAVLLNFRAFETMMEKAVVLLALIGVFVLSPEAIWQSRPGNFPSLPPPEPELALLLRALVPLSVLTAAYLLWAGADDPGGAFQGGTTLAAVAVLVVIAGAAPAPSHGGIGLRVMTCGGVAAFLIGGATCLLYGRGFLDYPPALAKVFVIGIEVGLLFSVAALLFLLTGGTPAPAGAEARRS